MGTKIGKQYGGVLCSASYFVLDFDKDSRLYTLLWLDDMTVDYNAHPGLMRKDWLIK